MDRKQIYLKLQKQEITLVKYIDMVAERDKRIKDLERIIDRYKRRGEIYGD